MPAAFWWSNIRANATNWEFSSPPILDPKRKSTKYWFSSVTPIYRRWTNHRLAPRYLVSRRSIEACSTRRLKSVTPLYPSKLKRYGKWQRAIWRSRPIKLCLTGTIVKSHVSGEFSGEHNHFRFIFSCYCFCFRDNPPGPSCTSAVQELSRLSQNDSIEIISPLQDWKWNNMELVSKFQELAILRNRLHAVACTSCSQFEDHVSFTWIQFIYLFIQSATDQSLNDCWNSWNKLAMPWSLKKSCRGRSSSSRRTVCSTRPNIIHVCKSSKNWTMSTNKEHVSLCLTSSMIYFYSNCCNIRSMSPLLFIYLKTFIEKIKGPVAEWSALPTGKCGDSVSIPARSQNFLQRN